MPDDHFSELRRPLQDALLAALQQLSYSHVQLLRERLDATSEEAAAFLPALTCALTAESLGAGREAALKAAGALALVEVSAYVIDDLVAAGSTGLPPHGLIGTWGAPRSLNAADGFFALANAMLLRLASEQDAPATLRLAAVFDNGVAAWTAETEGRLAAGEAASRHTSPALLEAAVRLGAAVAGKDEASASRLAASLLSSPTGALTGLGLQPAAASRLAEATRDVATEQLP